MIPKLYNNSPHVSLDLAPKQKKYNKTIKIYSNSSGGQKYKSHITRQKSIYWQDYAPYWGFQGKICYRPFHFLMAPGIPWLVAVQSLYNFQFQSCCLLFLFWCNIPLFGPFSPFHWSSTCGAWLLSWFCGWRLFLVLFGRLQGAGNRTQVSCRQSMCSSSLNHLTSPTLCFSFIRTLLIAVRINTLNLSFFFFWS